MAEWILRDFLHASGLNVLVSSAGLSALEGADLSAGAASVLRERLQTEGIHHKARRVTAERVALADLVLTMTVFHKISLAQAYPEAKERVFTLLEYAEEQQSDIDDPYGGDEQAYQTAAKQIERACFAVVKRMQRELGKSEGVPLQ